MSMPLSIEKPAGNIKKGEFVILKGRKCKIEGVTKSKTGKHGAAKVYITGID